MKKSKRVKKNYKRRRSHKKKGGDCPCKKNKSLVGIYGGYGAASYQGGINDAILPMNKSIGSSGDPSNASNMSSERFMHFTNYKGGKSRRRIKGGLITDPLLGDSSYTNPVLSAGTSVGGIDMARKITGQNSLV